MAENENFTVENTTSGGEVTIPDRRTITVGNVPKIDAPARVIRVNGVDIPPWHVATFVWAPVKDGAALCTWRLVQSPVLFIPISGYETTITASKEQEDAYEKDPGSR